MSRKSVMPTEHNALPGRATPLSVPQTHFVHGHRIVPPFPAGLREAVFGMGCFWGVERLFWQLPGVYSTAVGYACGFNSQGNVTMYITVTGAPGIHDIDIYPSTWSGPVTASNYQSLPSGGQQVNYDNPLLTPLDHPELMPSFPFTFLITSGSNP